MYLHTKYGTATINNIGDLLWMHFSRPEIKVTVAENSEPHSMTPTYISTNWIWGLICHIILDMLLNYVLLAVGELSCR